METEKEYDSSVYLVKRLISQHIKAYIPKIILAVLCMIVVAGTTALHAWLIQPVIDDIFLEKSFFMLKIVVAALVIVAAAKGAGAYGHSYIMQCVGQRIVTDMQIKLYDHLINSDLALITGESSGKIVSRFTNDINVLRTSVSVVMTGIVRELLTLIFLVGVMFYQSFTLSLIAFAAFPTAIYPVIRLGKRMRKISVTKQEELGEFTSRLDETFKGARVIKAYQQEDLEVEKASKIMERIYELFRKAARNQSAASPIIEALGGISIAAVIWYGGSQVIEGVTTPGKFTSFIIAVLLAYKPAKSLSGLNTSLQEGLAAAKRLFVLLDQKPEIKDKKNAKELKLGSKKGTIVLDNVKFDYSLKKPALRGVSLEVPAGKNVALVGPSGSGKSTIMNLILRFYDSDSGVIKIDGTDIRDFTIKSLRQNISFVSQDINLFDDTIARNIAYGRPDASPEDIKKAAKTAAADDFIAELPEGYETQIGQNGLTLSGGQRQRIAIARAMLKNSPILLLDEATSALDPISENKIQEALKKLMKGRTTIVIAHRLSTVQNADVIYVLKRGEVVESGNHNDLIEKEGEYGKLYKGLE